MTKEISTPDILSLLLNTLKLSNLTNSKEAVDWEAAVSQIRDVKNSLHELLGEEFDKALDAKLESILQEGFLDSLLPHILSIADLKREAKLMESVVEPRERQSKFERPPQLLQSENRIPDFEITIQCRDDGKNLSRDFQCRSGMLLKEMPYFSKAIKGQDLSDVDIKVHCDVNVFDWLIRWIDSQYYESLDCPKLESTTVVPILVSASFLEMEKLVEICLLYCHEHIHEILSANQSFGCVSDDLFLRFSNLFTVDEILNVQRPSIQSRLFTHLCENLSSGVENPRHAIFQPANTLFRCVACNLRLTRDWCSHVPCTQGRFTVLQSGIIVFRHTRDPSWSLENHIKTLKSELRSWSSIYWHLWGESHFARCKKCKVAFPLGQFGKCRYHPENPVFQKHRNISLPSGKYPCCGAITYRYQLLPENSGCRVRDHEIDVQCMADETVAKSIAFFNKHREQLVQQQVKNSVRQKSRDSLLNGASTALEDTPRWGGLERPKKRCLVPLQDLPWSSDESSVTESRSESATSRQTSRDTSAPGSVTSRGASLNSDKGTSGTMSEDLPEDEVRSEEDDHPSSPVPIRNVRIPLFRRKDLNPKPLPSYKNIDLRWNPLATTRVNQDNLREFEENLMYQMMCQHTDYSKTSQHGGVYQKLLNDGHARDRRSMRGKARTQSALTTAFAAAKFKSQTHL